MNDLKTTTKLVKHILENDELARNSDNYLYLSVIQIIADQKGINLYGISVPFFFWTMTDNGFPPFESVRRTRQKIQETNPELASNKQVAKLRKEQEARYFNYALGEHDG